VNFVTRWSQRRRAPEGVDPAALREATRPEPRRTRSWSFEEAREQAERLNELAVMSLFLHSAGTVEELLALFLERSPRATGAVVTYPLLLDRRRDVLHAAPVANLQDQAIEQASLAADVSLVDLDYPLELRSWRRNVMESGEVAITDDLKEVLGDVLEKDACDAIRRQLQITSVAVAPLVMEGETFGLCVFMYSGKEPDVEILELTAGHCTLALKDLLSGEESTRFGGIDTVTWVYSRGHLLEALDAEVVRARRNGRGLSLVLFDVDEFAQFNTSYGHTLGDRLLRAVAMNIASAIAPPEIVARYGGDEFAVLLPEANRAGAVELTSAIMAKLKALSVFDNEAGEPQGISVSAAIVSYPEDGSDREELLAAVEISIEQAKEENRAARAPARELTAVQQLRIAGRRGAA
jgi:diguanylate cyclase (GGDEF)-like protein